ncbi:exodeoxyribonuclease III [Flammeovirga kamogawensis]|uniref:Exodeoxyribonuclease III n=1 Tax=Flammeovirga kamogawensis TaxID=373891 RepID=A0ABX8GRV6_9BACT|nr:exodeoxyribonuclease III [Flammeovirga kamogawensis]MBB6463815.1 exodeoxyribonuclease-3 [Flammeovirga kamogawensis]QWG06168.1 exodeoxyribonuclease III [Flammeovirga kamogawensis]TRX67999.1 exodeoxyribonuclease III [Flammeovirga kamogawensis]
MKVISYNVNGIRAAIKKDLLEWVKGINPDVICLQEVKANEEQVDLEGFKALGYKYVYWHSAQKKGYSGVAIFSKVEAKSTKIGMGIDVYDAEGRTILCEFKDFTLVNTYFPSGTSGEERQKFKYNFLDDYFKYISNLKTEYSNLVICGDFNICHKAIDIHNPERNKNTSGFQPAEREWVTKFITEGGFVDAFRKFDESPGKYSWWTYRAGARGKNLGWRIDYFMVQDTFADRLTNSLLHNDAYHSDHCPVEIDFK